MSEIMLLLSIFIFLVVAYAISQEKERKLKIKKALKHNSIYNSFDQRHLNESPYQKYKQLRLNSPTQLKNNNDTSYVNEMNKNNNDIGSYNYISSNYNNTPPKSKPFDLLIDKTNSSNKFYSAKEEKQMNINNQPILSIPLYNNKNTSYMNHANQNKNIIYSNNDFPNKRSNTISIDDWSLSSHLMNIPTFVDNSNNNIEIFKVNPSKNLLKDFTSIRETKEEDRFKLPSFGDNHIEQKSLVEENNKNISINLNNQKIQTIVKPKVNLNSILKSTNSIIQDSQENYSKFCNSLLAADTQNQLSDINQSNKGTSLLKILEFSDNKNENINFTPPRGSGYKNFDSFGI